MNSLKNEILKIKPTNKKFRAEAKKKLDSLTKPIGSLGMLEEIAEKICVIKETTTPSIKKKNIFIFAGDHGIVEEKVSAYPKEVTAQMMYNFINGGACINVLASHIGAEIVLVDSGVAEDIKSDKFINKKIGYATKNFLKQKAMSKEEAEQSVLSGMEVVAEYAENSDLICVGDMGIGNTTSSSAIVSVITKTEPSSVTGRGTMIDDNTLKMKIDVIEQAIKKHKPDKNDPIDILSKIGGFEIGGIAGAILQAGILKIPVVVDGLITTAALLLAYKFNSDILDYVFASHNSFEKGHRIALQYLKLNHLLELNLRLVEGSGAALAVQIIETSIKILNEMETFKDAGVSEKNVD